MTKFIKNIIMQIITAIFNSNGYPYMGIPTQHWSSYVTIAFKTKYDHWKTLKNYICGIDTMSNYNRYKSFK
jgi:hypothetical protein